MANPEKHTVLETKKEWDDFFFRTPYFAFLDVLGYSNLVRKNEHKTLVAIYQTLFSAQMDFVEKNLRELTTNRSEKLGEKYTDPGIRIVNFSDSIMLWTAHGQPSALKEIMLAVSSLLALSMSQGLPLRGAITRQAFSVIERNNLLSVVGMGLVDAYTMEKSQQWSGCVISEEIVKYFASMEKVTGTRAISPLRQSPLAVDYEIPFVDKSGNPYKRSGHAVDWSDPMFSDAIIQASFEKHQKKDERADSDTPLKIQNTIDFHHFCLKQKANKRAADEAFRKSLGDENSEELVS
jgi:hypothetical protein